MGLQGHAILARALDQEKDGLSSLSSNPEHIKKTLAPQTEKLVGTEDLIEGARGLTELDHGEIARDWSTVCR